MCTPILLTLLKRFVRCRWDLVLKKNYLRKNWLSYIWGCPININLKFRVILPWKNFPFFLILCSIRSHIEMITACKTQQFSVHVNFSTWNIFLPSELEGRKKLKKKKNYTTIIINQYKRSHFLGMLQDNIVIRHTFIIHSCWLHT